MGERVRDRLISRIEHDFAFEPVKKEEETEVLSRFGAEALRLLLFERS